LADLIAYPLVNPRRWTKDIPQNNGFIQRLFHEKLFAEEFVLFPPEVGEEFFGKGGDAFVQSFDEGAGIRAGQLQNVQPGKALLGGIKRKKIFEGFFGGDLFPGGTKGLQESFQALLGRQAGKNLPNVLGKVLRIAPPFQEWLADGFRENSCKGYLKSLININRTGNRNLRSPAQIRVKTFYRVIRKLRLEKLSLVRIQHEDRRRSMGKVGR
jgi:hypothetical protein